MTSSIARKMLVTTTLSLFVMATALVIGFGHARVTHAVWAFANRTTANGLGSNNVLAVAVDGSNVYAGTYLGLGVSTDGGTTFTNVTTSAGLGHIRATGLVVVGSTVYAATRGGLSISTDGGMTFTNRTTTNGLVSNVVRGVAVSGSNVYAATEMGLSISDNGGATFTTPSDWVSLDVQTVAVSGSKIYAGSSGLRISTDGGATFTTRTTANGLGSNDVLSIAVVCNTVYVGTDGGLSISTDGGTTFTNRTTANGLGSNSVRQVVVSGSTIYAATSGGLSVSTDGGATFTNRTVTNGLGSNVLTGVAVNGTTVYAGAEAVGGTGGLSIGKWPSLSPATQTVTGTVGSFITPTAVFDALDFSSGVTYSFTPLPPGLTINVSTGVIVGIPTAASSSTATITATNGQETATATIAFSISEPPPPPCCFPVIVSPSTTTPTTTSSPPTTVRPTGPDGSTPRGPVVNNAGNPPAVPVGQVLSTLNGDPIESIIRESGRGTWQVSGPEFSIGLQGQLPSGLPPSGNPPTVMQNGLMVVSGEGYQPQSLVDLWVFSTPRFLGTVRVNANGRFEGTVTVPADLAAGDHTLQINGVNSDSAVRSVNVGLQIRGTNTRLPITGRENSTLIALAVAFIALGAITAARTRRHQTNL